MNLEKWEEIKLNIKISFGVIDSGNEIKDLGDGHQRETDWLEFESPIGKVKLEYSTSPLVLDKRNNFSNRVGADTKMIYKYSDDEDVSYLKAYQWDQDQEEWKVIDAKSFS
ncbi:MAG: hypothetical protein AUJ28_03595 [Parcubacteria group bacterium CG1_02_37_51]|uniref:Uncharacterized protein n=1 Tax=Candidatus Komeilibacteria bacterium CG_4_10_14_0_8_um_filter_37_78 TaxID=1974471 RepID=A0A2M7RDT2_9BACT|nr:MAG: hypothetical protein AUJ28_03595 [Parcubacteria group bacterium CG1_02_37_51]PIY94757.1 MAG: hypothetical protein COY67_02130 [Candidatus Komeilibacteria bacterium CG_4_10_14_0_8_um_filter_37_78]